LKILGLIPARGGSKGVPNKNIRIIDDRPLIHYTIESAQESKLLSTFIVDTDDDKIEQVAKQKNATVLKRPKILAQDDSNIVDVALRVIKYYDDLGEAIDILVLLQPTSPIKTGKNIDEAIQLLLGCDDTDAVISVVKMEDMHPARMYRLINENLIALNHELEVKRRQDLEPVFYRNGCIYVIRVNVLKTQKSFMPKNKKGYVMPSEWLANIDDERDLIITEALVKAWKEGRI
jgi:CMP-N-acetylneuraminic acid synthetase